MTGIAAARYRDLVELSLDGILLHSDGVIAFANAAAHRMIGLGVESIVGRRIDDFLPPPYLAAVRDELMAPGAMAMPFVERQVQRPDGGALDVEVSAVPFVFLDRPAVQVVLRDIGERVRQRASSALAESQFKLLAEQMPFVIWTTDVERRVVSVAGDRSSPFARHAQAALSAQAELELVSGAVDCTVEGRRYALRIEARQDAHGADLGVLGVAFDMTPWLRIQELLREGSRVDAMGQVAGGVAHEINNVLAIIAGLAMMIEQRSVPDDDVVATAREIIAATTRAAETTQSLLAFTMRDVHRPRPMSIDALTREVAETVARAGPTHVIIERTSTARRTEVLGDERRLARALLNVCWNAIDAMPGGGRLLIRTSDVEAVPGDERAWLRIEVIDTGIGMSEEVIARAFEPFFTAFSGGRHVGLGLSMAQGVVKQHEGRLVFASRPGQGTTVTLELPVAPPSPAEPEPESASVGGAAERVDVSMRSRVLVVDDESTLRKVSARLISRLGGLTCVEAANGAEAIQQFRESPADFAFVLLDVVMPDVSGVDVLVALQAIDPDVRAVIYSGFPRDERTAAACSSPNVEFLAKPFTREDLTTLVDRVTARVAPR